MTETQDFFASLHPVADFSLVTNNDNYTPLPDDWFIVLTDVKGSTKAIHDGAYKNVNMIGAACIMGILNIVGDLKIPYVFGGDGATLAIPPSLVPDVEEILIRLRHLSQDQFELGLRVGLIPVADIRSRGLDVNVLKYEISDGLFLAMFSGGGLTEADRLLKQDTPDNPYTISPSREPQGPPDLEGLSCRWEPLNSRNGQIVSLLVNAPVGSQGDKARIYAEILEKLTQILGQEADDFRPTSNENMRFRWPPRGLWTEAKLTANGESPFKTYLRLFWQSFIQFILEKTGKKAGSYDAPVYRKELLANTDFQRFDDMIRLVLDCRADQIEAIERELQLYYNRGQIAFGLHKSETALMTCLVFNLAEGAHLHFVDGGDGGFALAATGMKKQLAELASKVPAPTQ
ncbi:MAG: DUF3095 domain-containing protein [Sneathiella sp.]|nr:DUF3095 domain-containing protein [Sneathiella sp.]